VVDANLTVGDPDSTENLAGATVTIGNYAGAEDVLDYDHSLATSLSLTVDYTNGTLTFTGDASFADYQALLRSVTYENQGGDDPTAGDRVIRFAVSEAAGMTMAINGAAGPPHLNLAPVGGDNSVTITVTAANDPPTLTANTNDSSYTEDSGTPASLFTGAMASTVESGQTFTAMTLTATNISGSPAERLYAGNGFLALTDGNIATIDGVQISVGLSGSFATISFTLPNFSEVQLQNWVNRLA